LVLEKTSNPLKKVNPLSDSMSGIIVCAQAKIQKELKKRKAFDESSATDAEEAKINFKSILDLMEKGDLIGRTREGKIFMTQKGQQKQIST
jgi:hypothetical protein